MEEQTLISQLKAVNRQYVQRCLFNWRRQLGISLSVEEHAHFRKNKKYYLCMGELDPFIMCKMIRHFHPEFQFPSNPIPIPKVMENETSLSIGEEEKEP